MASETETRIETSETAPPTVPSAEPIEAELVPPPPSPWRFGLRAMMALMVVCSLQFALMNWFGVIYGLMLAIALCFIAFTAVFAVAVVVVRGNSVWLDRLDQIGIRLVIAMVVLIFGTVMAGGGKVAIDLVTAMLIDSAMQEDLGIRTERVYVIDNGNPVFGLEIKEVESGSIADKHGLREGEVILVPDGKTDDFYRELNRQRGKDVDVAIASKAANQPLEKCPQYEVTLPIPAR